MIWSGVRLLLETGGRGDRKGKKDSAEWGWGEEGKTVAPSKGSKKKTSRKCKSLIVFNRFPIMKDLGRTKGKKREGGV